MSFTNAVIPTRDEAVAVAEALGRGDADVIRALRAMHREWHEHADAQASDQAERRLRALIEVAAAVAAVHRLDEVLELAAEHALAATGGASLSISRWEASTETIQTLINVGQLAPCEERRPQNEIYRAADLPLWSRLFTGVPQLCAVDDPELDPVYRELLERLGKESSIGVAIRFRGEVWGELWATTAPGQPRFSGQDVVFLQTIAEQLGAAIGRAELFDRVAALAYTDPLTSVANRRALENALERMLSAPRQPVALIMCDVDGLKHVNDEHGHAAGDAVILSVSEALTAAAAGHEGSLVARIGGDEFCVLLPVGGLPGARAVVTDAVRLLRNREPPIRIACGVAVSHGGTTNELLRAADAAQYDAKRLGGELLRVAKTSPSESAACRRASLRRRSLRDGDPDPRSLVIEVLAELDGRLTHATPKDRLAAVAARVAIEAEATLWAVGFAPAGKNRITTLHSSSSEKIRLPRAALDHPAGFIVFADQDTSPVPNRFLRARHLQTCVGVATPTPDGTWLTLLLSEQCPINPNELLANLRLLALAAIASLASDAGERRSAA